jgi:hypothetical protein
MAFGFQAIDTVLGAEMYLKTIDIKPEPAPTGQLVRFGDLLKSEYAAIEIPSRVFCTDGNANLRMVN